MIFRRRKTITAETMRLFLRLAGSGVSLSEFLAWDEATQRAAAELYQEVVGERIYAMAMAIVDEGSRLSMMDPSDGGITRERTLIDAALDAAEDQILHRNRVESSTPHSVPLGRKG